MSDIWALVIHDERGLYVTLHEDVDDAFDALRNYLDSEPVSYQEPLGPDASREQIEAAADDRSQFAWTVTDVEAVIPGGTTTTEWGFRHPGYDHVSWSTPHVETQWTGHDGWTTGKYDEKDARYFAQGRPVVKREVTRYPDEVSEWEEA